MAGHVYASNALSLSKGITFYAGLIALTGIAVQALVRIAIDPYSRLRKRKRALLSPDLLALGLWSDCFGDMNL